MKIALVSCVSKKQEGFYKAEDLYISDWFIKAKQYVKLNYDKWYILSAKYGLVDPDSTIESYEEYLPKTSIEYRKQWANNVYNEINKLHDNKNEIHIFAGEHYRKYLLPLLKEKNYRVIIPLKSLGIGEQLKWFKDNTIY